MQMSLVSKTNLVTNAQKKIANAVILKYVGKYKFLQNNHALFLQGLCSFIISVSTQFFLQKLVYESHCGLPAFQKTTKSVMLRIKIPASQEIQQTQS